MTDRYWIAVDMDGTLLNSRGQISERTCAVLQKCLDQGHHVLPATEGHCRFFRKKSKIFREFRMRFLETDPLSGTGKRHVHYIKNDLPEGSAEQILKDVREMYRVHQEKAGKESRY